MGNWRTVNIKGKIDKKDVGDIVGFLSDDAGWYSPAACLTMGLSLCGLNTWVGVDGVIDASGNLAERDFDNDDIERALVFLAEKYPSLELTLHSGSDWESLECSATFIVANGKCTRMEPQIKELQEIRMLPLSEYFKRAKL